MSGRIGIVCGSWPPLACGVGDFTHRLAIELASQGHEIIVLTDRGAHADAPPAVHVLPAIESWRPPALRVLTAFLRRAGIAMVNVQYPTQQYGRLSAVDLVPATTRLRLHIPVVTTVHEYTTYRRLGQLRVRALARSSTAVIVPARDNLKALAAVPSLASRLHHVPLGPTIEPDLPVDFDRTAWRAAQGIGPDTLALVSFGFISPSKGVDTLLTAMELLPADCNVHLWLLADREPSHPRYTAYCAAIADQLATSARPDRVSWRGSLDAASLSTYLAAADLAVLPYTDGASLRRTTLLGALAHGLPVLSTGDQPPCAGVQVVPIGDATALATAIVRLSKDRSGLAAVAAKARQMACGFSWPEIARQTAAVFDAVVRRAGRQ